MERGEGGGEAFRRAIEKGPDWESRRERMLADLGKKAEILADLKSTIEFVTPDEDPGEVSAQLNESFSKTEAALPEAAARLKELMELRAEAAKVAEDIAAAETRLRDAAPQDERYMALCAREEAIETRTSALLADDGVRFLMNVAGAARSLSEKHRKVHGLSGDRGKAVARLREIKGSGIADTDILDVRFGGFDVGFIVTPEAYAKMKDGTSRGHYLPGTPYYVVRGGESADVTGTIIRHERSHNVIDSVAAIDDETSYPSTDLKLRFEEFEDGGKDGRESVERLRAEILAIDARTLIDGQQDEIIAALEAAERDSFGASPHTGEIGFNGGTGAFSTAGKEMRWADTFLKEKAEALGDDPELAGFCRTLSTELRHAFTRTSERLRSAFRVARRLGSEAADDVHSLAVILRPSQYGHMRRFLEHKYSAEAVEKAARADEMLDAGPTAEVIAAAVASAGTERAVLGDAEIEDLASQLRNFDFSFFADLGIRTLEECKAFEANVRKLAEIAGDPSLHETVEYSLWGQFAYAALERSVDDDLRSAAALYAQLSPLQKDIFEGALMDFLENYLLQDLGKDEMENEDIPTLPHWEAIRGMGLEDKAKKALGILS